MLSFLGAESAEVAQVAFHDFADNETALRGVPMRTVETTDGRRVRVATVYDLLFARFGVDRGLPGDYPRSYDDEGPYTPAWQEKYTGLGRKDVIQFAREWASTAEHTGGKCCIIIGAGVNGSCTLAA